MLLWNVPLFVKCQFCNEKTLCLTLLGPHIMIIWTNRGTSFWVYNTGHFSTQFCGRTKNLVFFGLDPDNLMGQTRVHSKRDPHIFTLLTFLLQEWTPIKGNECVCKRIIQPNLIGSYCWGTIYNPVQGRPGRLRQSKELGKLFSVSQHQRTTN